MSLYSAKRKAATQDFPSGEPSAIGMNKKLKEEWSCELCQIKATSENDLNDHLNGKKHKVREARQKREIDRHNKKSQNTVIEVTDTAVNSIISGVDAEKDQKTPNCCIVLNVMNENVVDTKSNNEEQLLETMVDNGVSVTESNSEKLEEMMVDKRVTESKNEEQHMEKNENVDFFESKKGAATEEGGKKSALTETMKMGGLWCELCQIGTTSQAVMEEHKKGKKHIKKMKMFDQKCLSSTSFAS